MANVRYFYSFLSVVFLLLAGVSSSKSQTTPPKNISVNIDAEMSKIREQLKSAPNSSDLHAQLAALASAKADWQAFDKEIAIAIQLDPARVTNYFGAAEVFRRRGLPGKASEMLKAALAVDSQNPLSHFFMGIFYEHEGDHEKAKVELQQTKKLLAELRLPVSKAKNRIQGDTYYDADGNPYLLDNLDKRVEKHLVQLNTVRRR